MEKPGILPASASKVDHLVVVVHEVVEEEDVQEVEMVVEVVTTVENQVTCRGTARKGDLAAAAVVVVVAATGHVTIVARQDTSQENVPTKWVVEENAQTRENVTTVMAVDTCHVIVLKAERDQIEAAWNVTSAMKWVILLETAPTPVEVVDRVMAFAAVEAVAVEAVAPVCAVTTATRWVTSRAIVQLFHHRQCHN